MPPGRSLVLLLTLAHLPASVAAQSWNDAAALALVQRGIARRQMRLADTTLRDFQVRAHGFVFFLGQLAEGLREPPRLIRSDELVLEVYWKAPDRSKQRIVGWRDRLDLPTDIQYHRDHLGIVQNNFADRIRLGEGDEVRDVPHPLAPAGPTLYDYAIADSLTIHLPRRSVRVVEVRVRPRDFRAARVVGNLYLDAETAEPVIFRFSFTSAAYLDRTLEDITIVLENGLWDERYWLPRRQEIEIRRRTRWLDLPARGIIRGRWEIGDYRFNLGLPDAIFRGAEFTAAPPAVRDTFRWDEPLDAAIREMAGPVMTFDLEETRDRVEALAEHRALTGLAASRPAVGAVSDLARFNRVEGLALGLGWLFRPDQGATEVALWGSYGLGDERVKGAVSLQHRVGGVTLSLEAARRVRDIGDDRVIAPLLNSLFAQELGRDYGDWVLRDQARAGVRRDFGVRGGLGISVGVERTTSVTTTVEPASGEFRPTAALGAGTLGFAELSVERRSPELAVTRGWSGRLTVEGGLGDTTRYVRARASGRAHLTAGPTRFVARGWIGWGSAELPAYRSFLLGGRGTLVGEPFRVWGGRAAALAVVEWQLRAPFPALRLAPGVTTGRRVTVAPYVGLGWAAESVPRTPWVPTDGVRPVSGLAIEWFHRFFRVDVGYSWRDRRVRAAFDVSQDLWPIL